MPGASPPNGFPHNAGRHEDIFAFSLWLRTRILARASSGLIPVRLIMMPTAWSITSRLAIDD